MVSIEPYKVKEHCVITFLYNGKTYIHDFISNDIFENHPFNNWIHHFVKDENDFYVIVSSDSYGRPILKSAILYNPDKTQNNDISIKTYIENLNSQ